MLSGMNLLRNPSFFLQNSALVGNALILAGNLLNVRFASKKTGGSTRNTQGRRRPKHRGIHYQDGKFVQKGTMLVTQNKLRCHPGMNVGFGRNGTLFAMEAGRVMVTCEKIDPKLEHTWIARTYGGRNLENVYKKYFHVIPLPQHCRFKLNDVSSVLNRDVKNYGKQHLFDGNEETCWSSDEGSPQWIIVTFNKDVVLESVVLQFQGGFAGANCEIEVGNKLVRTFIPENTNAIQEVSITPSVAVSSSDPVKLIFCESTDFFGRIILYRLGFGVVPKNK